MIRLASFVVASAIFLVLHAGLAWSQVTTSSKQYGGSKPKPKQQSSLTEEQVRQLQAQVKEKKGIWTANLHIGLTRGRQTPYVYDLNGFTGTALALPKAGLLLATAASYDKFNSILGFNFGYSGALERYSIENALGSSYGTFSLATLDMNAGMHVRFKNGLYVMPLQFGFVTAGSPKAADLGVTIYSIAPTYFPGIGYTWKGLDVGLRFRTTPIIPNLITADDYSFSDDEVYYITQQLQFRIGIREWKKDKDDANYKAEEVAENVSHPLNGDLQKTGKVDYELYSVEVLQAMQQDAVANERFVEAAAIEEVLKRKMPTAPKTKPNYEQMSTSELKSELDKALAAEAYETAGAIDAVYQRKLSESKYGGKTMAQLQSMLQVAKQKKQLQEAKEIQDEINRRNAGGKSTNSLDIKSLVELNKMLEDALNKDDYEAAEKIQKAIDAKKKP